jgi:prepilin-type N-terminal cleavage/methylation domain-containing protein
MNKKGFTLIEIVIVIVVLAIIGGFTMSFLISNSQTYQMMRVQRELYQDGVYIMERISSELRDARAWNSANNVFYRSNVSALQDKNITIRYSQTGTNLNRESFPVTMGPVTNQPIGRNLKAGSFGLAFDATNKLFIVSLTLELECARPDNQKCTLTFTQSVFPNNFCDNGSPNLLYNGFSGTPCLGSVPLLYNGSNYNGDYEEVIN